MYVCAIRMCGTHRGLQGALDPLGLELQIVKATMWVLGTKIGPLEEQSVLLTTWPPLQPQGVLL